MIRRATHQCASGKIQPRFGSAVVELALVLPVLVLIVFGSIEASNAIYLQQVLTEVAYQGALEGVDISATEQNVVDRMQDYVDQTAFTGVTFDVVGTDGSTDFDDLIKGQSFRVIVTAPYESMSIGIQAFSGLDDLSASRVANR
ncbi:pilus assembly protein [Saprospiraceae bacterium]|nr:pilus assembly protein [Saprospiraceae bacterium]